MATSMLGFEGAVKGTKKDGPRKQVQYKKILTRCNMNRDQSFPLQVAQILLNENPRENNVREAKLM